MTTIDSSRLDAIEQSPHAHAATLEELRELVRGYRAAATASPQTVTDEDGEAMKAACADVGNVGFDAQLRAAGNALRARRSTSEAKDAARWRALFMGRVRVLGSAMLHEPAEHYTNNWDGYAHIGVELWTKYPEADDAASREWFTKYADTAVAAMSAAASAEAPTGFYLASYKRHKPGAPITWWGADDSGYTTDIEQAGVYHDITPGYHDSEHTVPVPGVFLRGRRIRRTIDPGDSANAMFWSAEKLRAALAGQPKAVQP